MPFVLGKSFIFAHPVFSIYQFKTYPKNMSKILIVDDEVQIRTLLARMMELRDMKYVRLVIAGLP